MKVACPQCGESRELGYAAVWAINHGLNSGNCNTCANVLRRKPHHDRIMARVGPPDENGCWPWLGHRTPRGYGHAHDENGKSDTAYRITYKLLVGPIPDGLQLDHLCRNPSCVNPAHLEPVTKAENLRRAGAAITHCPQGHEYTPENTHITPKGHRRCQACNRLHASASYHRKRAAA